MALDLDHARTWADGRRTAVLITIRRDGSPQSSDVSYSVRDDAFVVSLTASRAKTANMRRDPRVILHVTAPDQWSYVAFSGEAELSEPAQSVDDEICDRLVEYYEAVAGAPHPDWDEYRQAMVDEGRLLLTLRPVRAVGQIH